MKPIKALLSLLVLSQASYGLDPINTGTGSTGQFSPKAFLEASIPWQTYRFSGVMQKSGFPCDAMGNGCRRESNYTIFSVRPQHNTTEIHTGIPTPLATIDRQDFGTVKKVEIKRIDNLTIARIDGTRASSRLGFAASETATLSKVVNSYGAPETMGHIEMGSAKRSLVNPSSVYYHVGEKTEFGLTTVDKIKLVGAIQNEMANTPGVGRFRDGTYWCSSNQWKLNEGMVTLLKNANFDFNSCQGNMIFKSETINELKSLTSGFFLNRQDSTIQYGSTSYKVVSNPEWLCLVDCDGTTYSVKDRSGVTKVLITSDRWNWLSTTRFKIKIFQADMNGDGRINALPKDVNLNDLAQKSSVYEDVVAVLVTEIADGPQALNGKWTQHTFLLLPPSTAEVMKARDLDNSTTKATILRLRILDAVLAMMPDQTQTSPELSDLESKIDELRLTMRYQGFGGVTPGPAQVTSDLLMDVFSEIDPTTSISWNHPVLQQKVNGKIDFILGLLRF